MQRSGGLPCTTSPAELSPRIFLHWCHLFSSPQFRQHSLLPMYLRSAWPWERRSRARRVPRAVSLPATSAKSAPAAVGRSNEPTEEVPEENCAPSLPRSLHYLLDRLLAAGTYYLCTVQTIHYTHRPTDRPTERQQQQQQRRRQERRRRREGVVRSAFPHALPVRRRHVIRRGASVRRRAPSPRTRSSPTDSLACSVGAPCPPTVARSLARSVVVSSPARRPAAQCRRTDGRTNPPSRRRSVAHRRAPASPMPPSPARGNLGQGRKATTTITSATSAAGRPTGRPDRPSVRPSVPSPTQCLATTQPRRLTYLRENAASTNGRRAIVTATRGYFGYP